MRSPFHGRTFRPGLLPTLLMLPLLALLLWLGHWQWTRAADKQALLDRWAAQAAMAPVPLPANPGPREQFLRVQTTGAYLPARQVLLDNQTHDGRAGYRVLTPLQLADGRALMVDRGWVPLPGNARDQLPDITISGGGRQVLGRLDHFRQAALKQADPTVAAGTPAATARANAPATAPATAPAAAVRDSLPRVMNYPDAAAVASAIGYPVYPFVLLLEGTEPDGFVRVDAPTLSFGPERHVGYAIQWWALALTLVLLWGWTAMKPETA